MRNIKWLGIFLLVFLFFPNVVKAQTTFPKGGSDFSTAVEITPGEYQGGEIDWEDNSSTKQFYYLNNVKDGQIIQTKVKFLGNSNLDLALYDGKENKLTYFYGGGEDYETLVWLTDSKTKSGKYYLVFKNDSVDKITNLTLSLNLYDRFDANSQADAGETIDQALAIVPGNYQGYLSGEEGKDEIDFYRLSLKKGARTTVKITPSTQDSINLAVFDVNRSQLEEKSPNNAGEITTLTFVPANDGNYYLKLSCYHGCKKVVDYKMEISGSVLPTGGGLMTTDTPQTTIVPLTGSQPSTFPVKTGTIALNRDLKFILIIAGTILLIIIIVYFLLNKKPPEKDEPQMNSGSPDADKATVGYKHPCKYCDKLIPPNSRSCPFCGKNNPQGPIRCPKCNTPIEKDWKVCNHCDLPLSIKCPHCNKTTFFGEYCEHCDKRLVVTCPNCKTEQPPISNKCKKCNKLLKINQ